MIKTSENPNQKSEEKKINLLVLTICILISLLFILIAGVNSFNNRPKAHPIKESLKTNQDSKIKEHIEFFSQEAKTINNKDLKSDMYSFLGRNYFYTKQYNEAVKAYKEVIKINPENTAAWINIGSALVHLEDYGLALEYLEKAKALNPEIALIYDNLGVIFINKGYLLKGIENFKKAIRINPEFYNAYINLVSVYFMVEDYHKAEKIINKAKEHNIYNSPKYKQKILNQTEHLEEIKQAAHNSE
jgi:tetratricopeptide (TPR) repeat protein